MGGKTPSTKAQESLAFISGELAKRGGPMRNTMMNQITEAMRTGGVGARIPIIQRAVEAQMGAGARQNQALQANLGRAGVAGSPFANAAMAKQNVETSSRVADIGPQIAQQLISQGATLFPATTGIPGLASAAEVEGQQNAAQAGQKGAAYGAAGEGAGAIMAALLSKYMK